MTREEFVGYARGCTHFFSHYPSSVRQRTQDIADSPYAEFGPDHYGNGGFVAEFEKEIAQMLGKESAVFMPSGTMAQQIALRIWSDRSGIPNVAFHPMCHLEKHEHMAYSELHHLHAVLLGEPDRLFTLADLLAVEKPLSSLLIEFPQRDLGGELPTWDEFQSIVQFAQSKNIKLHLDGARLWECGPYYQRSYADIVASFDSVYVSFYKVLNGLPGAALAGPADFILESRIWMRRHGGNLVHMFPNAISAKIGIDRHLPLMPRYVAKGAEVAQILNELDGITVVPANPQTNMMHLLLDAPKNDILDAVGEIAKREKCLLFGNVSETNLGQRLEFYIGDGGLDLPADRIRDLFREMLARAANPSAKEVNPKG